MVHFQGWLAWSGKIITSLTCLTAKLESLGKQGEGEMLRIFRQAHSTGEFKTEEHEFKVWEDRGLPRWSSG